jgi:hypothetical protein
VSDSKITALLVLGRVPYALSCEEMTPFAPLKDGLSLQQALEHWLEAESPEVKSAIPIIWEPTGDHALTHDRIDVPRVDRAGFASLEEVKKKYQGIATSTNAWGFEPLPKGLMNGKVFLHVETVPVIQMFGDTAISQGVPISAVWALPTVAFNGFGRGIGVKVLAVAPGFCGIYTLPNTGGPTRGVVSVIDTNDETSARNLYPALEAAGFFNSDAAPKAWKIVGAMEDLQALIPILEASDPRVVEFMTKAVNQVRPTSWGDFIADGIKKLPRGGTQDLWATFPQPFPLGTVFRWASGVFALIALIFAGAAIHTNKVMADTARLNQAVEQSVAQALADANSDLKTFDDLKAQATGRDTVTNKAFPRGRAAILRVLSENVPQEYTLTGLTVGNDGGMSIDFFQVVDGADTPDSLLAMKNNLQRAGFGNCQIQPVATVPDSDTNPVMAEKRHYHLTAIYTAPAGL